MEKEKPYRCESCGKRYKNTNGLKYHRKKFPHCNQGLKLGGEKKTQSPAKAAQA
jgi:transcription factor SFP1